MIEERQMMRSCKQTREEEHTGIDPHRGRLLLKVLLHMFDEGGHERIGGELIRLQQFRDPLQNSLKLWAILLQWGVGGEMRVGEARGGRGRHRVTWFRVRKKETGAGHGGA